MLTLVNIDLTLNPVRLDQIPIFSHESAWLYMLRWRATQPHLLRAQGNDANATCPCCPGRGGARKCAHCTSTFAGSDSATRSLSKSKVSRITTWMSKRTKEEQTVEKFNHASGEIRSDRAPGQMQGITRRDLHWGPHSKLTLRGNMKHLW